MCVSPVINEQPRVYPAYYPVKAGIGEVKAIPTSLLARSKVTGGRGRMLNKGIKVTVV